MKIPNFRIKEEREPYRNDKACTDPKVAGDQLLPTCSLGTPNIPDEVYDSMKKKWQNEFKNDEGYTSMAFRQSSKKAKGDILHNK